MKQEILECEELIFWGRYYFHASARPLIIQECKYVEYVDVTTVIFFVLYVVRDRWAINVGRLAHLRQSHNTSHKQYQQKNKSNLPILINRSNYRARVSKLVLQ